MMSSMRLESNVDYAVFDIVAGLSSASSSTIAACSAFSASSPSSSSGLSTHDSSTERYDMSDLLPLDLYPTEQLMTRLRWGISTCLDLPLILLQILLERLRCLRICWT